MIGMDSNHCRVVTESLTGARGVDEHTFASLEILHERLERVRKLDDAFAGISFSDEVKMLQSNSKAVTVS